MAKREKANITVSGKSIQDLLNLTPSEINKLNPAGMARVVTRLKSAANKRLKRFEKAGISTPATRAYNPRSTVGMNKKQLQSLYKDLKGFLTAETGTRQGYRKFLKRFKKGLKDHGVEIPDFGKTGEYSQYIDKFFRLYERIKERFPKVAERMYKYGVFTDITDALKDNQDIDATYAKLEKQLQESYEEEQEEREKEVFGAFDIGDNE